MTPFNPSMNGMTIPKYSSSNRFTDPFSPNNSSMATAPTNGGMISGTMPSV